MLVGLKPITVFIENIDVWQGPEYRSNENNCPKLTSETLDKYFDRVNSDVHFEQMWCTNNIFLMTLPKLEAGK